MPALLDPPGFEGEEGEQADRPKGTSSSPHPLAGALLGAARLLLALLLAVLEPAAATGDSNPPGARPSAKGANGCHEAVLLALESQMQPTPEALLDHEDGAPVPAALAGGRVRRRISANSGELCYAIPEWIAELCPSRIVSHGHAQSTG